MSNIVAGTYGQFISDILDTMADALGYNWAALLVTVVFGTSIYIAILSIVRMYTPAPDRQITRTWELVSNFGLIKPSKTKRSLDEEHQREAKFLDKKKYIETSYRRLGKTFTYDDYVKAVGTYRLLGMLVGAACAIIGILVSPILIILGLLLVLLGLLFADSIAYWSVNSRIKSLNKYQKLELPVLISRFMAIATSWKQYPLRDVLGTYLPYAGALRYDIELALADIKSFGDMMALDLWQARATHHNTTDMMEFTQFVEKIKKLYSKGDEIYVRNELSMLQRTIDEKYVATLIDKIGRNRTLKLIVIMIGAFAVAGLFFIMPKILEIAEAMNNTGL